MDGSTHMQIDRTTDTPKDGRPQRWTNRHTDGATDGPRDPRMDAHIHRQIPTHGPPPRQYHPIDGHPKQIKTQNTGRYTD